VAIYRSGDISERAYIIKGSPAYIDCHNLPGFKIDPANCMLGVVELFLTEEHEYPRRIFGLSTDQGAEVEQIDFKTVLELTRRCSFGVGANRFLSLLIDKTNQLIRATIRNFPEEWGAYQERAALFVELVSEFQALYQNNKIDQYGKICKQKLKSSLYKDGARFKHERAISKISLIKTPIFESTQYRQEAVICRAGDKADSIYVLLKGSVAVVNQGNILATITESGEAFGELAFFIEGKRTADLVAAKGSAVYQIHRFELANFHAQHPEMFVEIARTLAKRLNANLQNLAYYKTINSLDAEQHFARLNDEAANELKSFADDLKKIVRVAADPAVTKLISMATK